MKLFTSFCNYIIKTKFELIMTIVISFVLVFVLCICGEALVGHKTNVDQTIKDTDKVIADYREYIGNISDAARRYLDQKVIMFRNTIMGKSYTLPATWSECQICWIPDHTKPEVQEYALDVFEYQLSNLQPYRYGWILEETD